MPRIRRVLVLRAGAASSMSLSPSRPTPIVGTAKDDMLVGTNGRDDLRGRRGADRIRGRRGNDWLFGGRGRDVLRGGEEETSSSFGRGNETIWPLHRTKNRVHLGRGDDIAFASASDRVALTASLSIGAHCRSRRRSRPGRRP